jgi:hypothetical protein
MVSPVRLGITPRGRGAKLARCFTERSVPSFSATGLALAWRFSWAEMGTGVSLSFCIKSIAL